MAEYSEQELIRRESLAKLRELGIEPYPAAEYPVNATAEQILKGHAAVMQSLLHGPLAGGKHVRDYNAKAEKKIRRRTESGSPSDPA